MQWFCIPTAHGSFLAHYSDSGLVELRFPEADATQGNDIGCGNHWHTLTTAAVIAILRGASPGELPPLDLAGHTPFRVRVWEQLRRIPLGEAATYAQIAARLGEPNATRAVGGACGANPIPLIIPCHRVLAAGGKLGGFSGGLHWKRKLLSAEGIKFDTLQEQLDFESNPRFPEPSGSVF